MKRIDRAYLVIVMAVVLRAGVVHAQEARQTLTAEVETEPIRATFVYRDAENFLSAHHLLGTNPDTLAVLQSEYFDRASPGLLLFIEKYDLTPERLIGALREYPEAYATTADKLAVLRTEESAFKKAYADLAELIPEAVFPPTYFVVGAHRGIGSGSVEGPLISIGKETPESIRGDLSATLVHEMMHMQQLAAVGEEYFSIFSGEEQTLLATSIREGAAMYFAELVTGGSVHKNAARDFLLANEARLWAEFREQMPGNDMGDWLWNAPTDPDQPRDVGYAMGARIVQAFYERAEDKLEAARIILSVTDYPAFLAMSGYDRALPDG